jgi:DNA-directed RNA polymerase alpha subunit
MKIQDQSEILDVPVEHIACSDEFLEMCSINEFKNLRDIIEYPAYELLKKEKFGARMLKELYTILKAYKLQDKLIE